MTQYVFNNNAVTTLGSSLGSAATTMTVATGTGVSFPSPGAGQVVSITLIAAGSTTGVPNEIVYVTNRTGDTFTIERGQEGTTAQDWSTGDIVSNRATAYFLNQQATAAAIQQQAGNYANDTGAANSGAITLSPAPANLAALVGIPIRVLKMGTSNTGAYVLNVNGFGGVAVTIGGNAMGPGQLLSNQIFEVMFDGTNFELLSTPSAIGTAQLAGQAVTNSILAQMAGKTVKANLGTGAAAPSDVSLASLLAALGAFGSGYTWTSPARSLGSTYTNDTSGTIIVNYWSQDGISGGYTTNAFVNGLEIAHFGTNYSTGFLSFPVEAGATYQISSTNTGSKGGWVEFGPSS